ncbi:MAG: LysR family transcriptional regulator [Proteobacteria bacterium]|nr:LysR family transcriptional regulator [Pseudomonadota bacterium]
MNKLDLAEALIAIADTGSIYKAADELHQTSAAISKKLSKLESHLKTRLVIRERKGLSLTAAGQHYYHEAKKAVNQFVLAEQSVAQEMLQPQGELKVVAKQFYVQTIILPKLSEFLERYPKLNVNLDTTDMLPNFDSKKMDILFGCADTYAEGIENLIRKKIDISRFGLYASPIYLKKKGIPKNSSELLKHDFIAHGFRKIPGLIVLDNNEQIIVNPKFTWNNTTLIVQAALSHLGFIWADEKIVFDLVAKKKLVGILENHTRQITNICLFYDSQYKFDPRIRAFIDFFIQCQI